MINRDKWQLIMIICDESKATLFSSANNLKTCVSLLFTLYSDWKESAMSYLVEWMNCREAA